MSSNVCDPFLDPASAAAVCSNSFSSLTSSNSTLTSSNSVDTNCEEVAGRAFLNLSQSFDQLRLTPSPSPDPFSLPQTLTREELFKGSALWADRHLEGRRFTTLSLQQLQELKREEGALLKLGEELFKQFQEADVSSNLPCQIGNHWSHRALNRWVDILPFDGNRVQIHGRYLNASPIRLNRDYIASQAPVEASLPDYFRMIDQYGVEIIVVLTDVWEKGTIRALDYWSFAQVLEDDYSQSEPIGYAVLGESQLNGAVTCYDLKVQERGVKLYHYSGWPDFGVPDIAYFRELLEATGSGDKPLLVHCSAGVGRSGTFIAAHHLLQRGGDPISDEIPLEETFMRARACRKGMIQKPGQLAGLLEVLVHKY